MKGVVYFTIGITNVCQYAVSYRLNPSDPQYTDQVTYDARQRRRGVTGGPRDRVSLVPTPRQAVQPGRWQLVDLVTNTKVKGCEDFYSARREAVELFAHFLTVTGGGNLVENTDLGWLSDLGTRVGDEAAAGR